MSNDVYQQRQFWVDNHLNNREEFLSILTNPSFIPLGDGIIAQIEKNNIINQQKLSVESLEELRKRHII